MIIDSIANIIATILIIYDYSIKTLIYLREVLSKFLLKTISFLFFTKGGNFLIGFTIGFIFIMWYFENFLPISILISIIY